jgi:5-methylcytosine rRNA methyltransferase NSUN4
MALEPREESEVLDMCAAPGGKSLVLTTCFPGIRLAVNERSGRRRERLRRVLQEHLGDERASEIPVFGHDARTWFAHERDRYPYILLDVPCSSERHIISSPLHLSKWSSARSRHLAVQAFVMLASALEVLTVGGILLYSTCALTPIENDGVLEKLHKKRQDRFELLEVRLPFGEKTRYGWQVLPDTSEGRGPMYAAKIKRTS